MKHDVWQPSLNVESIPKKAKWSEGPLIRGGVAYSDLLDTYDFRKVYGAKSTDYFGNIINYVTSRAFRSQDDMSTVAPYPKYASHLFPTSKTIENPLSAICTQWTNTVYNHDYRRTDPAISEPRTKGYFSNMIWVNEGRRLIASTSTGEFALWNGHSYTIEGRTLSHEEAPCRSLAYAPINEILFSADDLGVLKIWKLDLKCIAKLQAHSGCGCMIREITVSPSEMKFLSAGKDGTVRVWDTETQTMMNKFQGHGSDVTSCSWHSDMALIATASLDNNIRLWDPRTPRSELAIMQGHMSGVGRVRFNPTCKHWLLSASKDNTIRLWDIRKLDTVSLFRGHTKEPTGIEWHPHHSTLFTSAGLDGILAFFIVNYGGATLCYKGRDVHNRWMAAINRAHGTFRSLPTGIQNVTWHPLGHVVATCSFDGRLWTRNKVGSEIEVNYSESEDSAYDVITTRRETQRHDPDDTKPQTCFYHDSKTLAQPESSQWAITQNHGTLNEKSYLDDEYDAPSTRSDNEDAINATFTLE